MLTGLFKKVFGSKNDRELKRMGKIVKAINALEADLEKLTDEAIKGKKLSNIRQRLEVKVKRSIKSCQKHLLP